MNGWWVHVVVRDGSDCYTLGPYETEDDARDREAIHADETVYTSVSFGDE